MNADLPPLCVAIYGQTLRFVFERARAESTFNWSQPSPTQSRPLNHT